MSLSSAQPSPPRGEQEDADDCELVQRAASGDWRAFEKLYGRHARAVFAYSYSILRDRESADDVSQESWIAFWDGRRRISLAGKSLLPWLLVTARHKALRRLRTEATRAQVHHSRRFELATTDTDPQEQLDRIELARRIELLVAQLDPLDRRIYALCLENGSSYAAAAEQLKTSVGAVRGRLFRIRKYLRASLNDSGVNR